MIPEEWDRNFSSIWDELNRTLRSAAATTAVLLDTSGNAVTYAGDDPDFDLSSFASLAVADYMATQEMAVLLGEESMRWVVHQGINGGLVMVPLHPLLILAVLFDNRTTLGLVRHEIRKNRPRLETATLPLLGLLERQLLEAGLEDEAGDDASLDDLSGSDLIDRGLDRLFGPTA
jgi:predicted regulator of Ras-like GTPase activity (Roadblock/LC7/MglB family)